ncbi:MAG: hypothetical protein A2664_03380 [Candidatus Taylorbacteria bacterium RIFCSPHIGHO2_01_FULL_46_22b]|uniref:Uncharacterized protein n=1 Tax=Candidatus Taylorbacteria bacterium RIFCSPHIGHO2_01_FULL_46_22b TaxID=1802301 RepID=A0A1G2M197_9BACT|nr:MAG: hypothetical protein A2664_03380 [Candidatus Taylorbacteria bacterium RIFCSPHIGHO2_01_FULL_46_22b]
MKDGVGDEHFFVHVPCGLNETSSRGWELVFVTLDGDFRYKDQLPTEKYTSETSTVEKFFVIICITLKMVTLLKKLVNPSVCKTEKTLYQKPSFW